MTSTTASEPRAANEGRVGRVFEGIPMLLLHHAGAKSGQRRINPLAYLITRPLTNDQRANRDSHDPRIGQAQAAGS
jgi:hypothetical protein